MVTADLDVQQIAREICANEDLLFVGPVGAGAFKETFHVTTPAGESLALKVYRHALNERTVREIDAMRRCQHPNIGRFHSLHEFECAGQALVYSLEEFLSGGSLAQRVKNGFLSVVECRAIGCRLIDAVGHIARLDLVHRDIKPENIMFREDGSSPVIVDFGLVRDLSATSATASWALRGPGTPFFASPEQLNNDKHMIDWRSDQFGLGVTLAVATFGRHPYAAASDTLEVTVERVAARGGPSEDFISSCRRERLVALAKMVQPWPVLRYRTPSDLGRAWDEESTP